MNGKYAKSVIAVEEHLVPEPALNDSLNQDAIITFNSGGAGLLLGVRATAGAGDAVVAGTRLSGGFATRSRGPGDEIEINLDTPTSRVDLVGIMNGTAANNCIDISDSLANALANMETRTFANPVVKIVISILPSHGSGQYAVAEIGGFRRVA